MNYEVIGTVASVIVLISFTFKEQRHIRTVNILGALIFVIYGLLISAFSIWFLNSALIIIHIYNLFKS